MEKVLLPDVSSIGNDLILTNLKHNCHLLVQFVQVNMKYIMLWPIPTPNSNQDWLCKFPTRYYAKQHYIRESRCQVVRFFNILFTISRGSKPPNTFTHSNGQSQVTNREFLHFDIIEAYGYNAAAIWIEKGTNIIVRNCTMRDSGNGLFVSIFSETTPTRVSVEHSWSLTLLLGHPHWRELHVQ